ncbi:TPA: hypothetical protein ACQ30S_004200 [Yersinia enterocolitica]
MRISRDDIEKDMVMLLRSMRDNNYIIPTNKEILTPILKVVFLVLTINIVGILIDYSLSSKIHGPYFSNEIFHAVFLNIMASVVILAFPYSFMSMALCIKKEVRDSSLLIKLIRNSVGFHLRNLIIFNVIVGIAMLLIARQFIFFLGASWFISSIITIFIFNISMSRYFTPSVIDGMRKLKEIISPSAPVTVEK